MEPINWGKLAISGPVLAALIALSACTTTPKGSFCSVADPARLSDATVEAMTDEEIADALEHNLKGARLCGWKP